MSENTLNTQIDGTTIQASHVNQYKTALVEDFLPRNLSGQNEDEAGSLGSDLFRWLKGIISTVFTNKISFGAAGDEVTNPFIENSGDTMNLNVPDTERYTFRVNNTLIAVIDEDGFDGAYMKGASLPVTKLIRDRARDTRAGDSTSSSGAITSLTATITASGLYPVLIKAQSTDAANFLFPNTGSGLASVYLRKDESQIFRVGNISADSAIVDINFIDYSASGECSYDIYVDVFSGTVGWSACELIAMEL